MSLISTLYFSSKSIHSLQDLEQDTEALNVDFSSRGLEHPALMEEELNLTLPKGFSTYTKKILVDGEEEKLVQLSSEFISNYSDIDLEDLHKINEQINQNFSNSKLEQGNKVGINDLSKGVKIISGVLFGLSLVTYFQYNEPIISLFFIAVMITYILISFKRYKAKRERYIKSKSINFTPQLQELVSACRKARDNGLSVFYYWSL